MKYLKSYKIFEELTKSEYNKLLDKINDLGINSLTAEEKNKLDNFNGDYQKDDKPETFDTSYQSLKKYIQPTNSEPKKIQDDKPIISIVRIISSKLRLEDVIVLNSDDRNFVALDHKLEGLGRVYYILFKKIKDSDDSAAALKLVYNLNARGNTHWNFNIYDNHMARLDFNKLDVFLNEHGLTYGDFNEAWYYIEDNFNNQGYN